MAPNDKKPETKEVKTEESPAPESLASVMERAIQAAVTTSVTAVAGLLASQIAANRPKQPKQPRDFGGRCMICQQYMTACEGEHVLMCVFPPDTRKGKWFQGVRINNIHYISNNNSHQIPVPANCQALIKKMIDDWQNEEDNLKNGREGSFDSGSIGPGGSQYRQADGMGWR